MNGIFFVNKEKAITTRKLDNLVAKKFQIKKVGHLGTLDPLATGLVFIGVGEGSKIFPYLENLKKTYVATFKLGLLTSTLDLEGEVISDNIQDEISLEHLQGVVNTFVGKIRQIPPLTSAIKVNGVPLYKYAHKKIDMEVPPRVVEIFSIKIVDFSFPLFSIECEVSKGTYIRTLGNDIANKLNTVATTTNLKRTKIGSFSLNDAKTLDELTIDDLISPSKLVDHMPRIDVDEFTLSEVLHGKKIKLDTGEEEVALFYKDVLLAVYEKSEDNYKCKRGFNIWKN